MWTAVLAGAACCYAFKVAGLSVPRRLLDHPRTQRISALLPIALLAGLALTQTVSTGTHLVLDARSAGLAVAIVAVSRRAPFLLVVILASATAAAVRLMA